MDLPRGKITQLNEPGTIGVSIDFGVEQGIRAGEKLDVYRGHRHIGSLRINRVFSRRATATLVSVEFETRIRVGDTVIRDDHMVRLHKLLRESKVKDADQLGRAFAEADIRAGLVRVIQFGMLRSRPDTHDKETGYPIRWAAGCIVSIPFTVAVREYNATVRAHFRKGQTKSPVSPRS